MEQRKMENRVALSTFKLELPAVQCRGDILYPPRKYRRSWTHSELLEVFPEAGINILDIGAGNCPFKKRDQDNLITVDFDKDSSATVVMDVSSEWPFEREQFDLIYMSHVLEHFYPVDRDRVIRNIYSSLKPGGLLFIRVPHWSSNQAFGLEHYSFYGLNGLTSLCHGYNPNIPMFRAVSTGVAMTIDFYGRRSFLRSALESMLNRSWNLTDRFLCYLVGGIPEVQFVVQRMPPELEAKLRSSNKGD